MRAGEHLEKLGIALCTSRFLICSFRGVILVRLCGPSVLPLLEMCEWRRSKCVRALGPTLVRSLSLGDLSSSGFAVPPHQGLSQNHLLGLAKAREGELRRMRRRHLVQQRLERELEATGEATATLATVVASHDALRLPLYRALRHRRGGKVTHLWVNVDTAIPWRHRGEALAYKTVG